MGRASLHGHGYDILVDLETGNIDYSRSSESLNLSFCGSLKEVEFIPEETKPCIFTLELNISQACNMGCTYCFANQGVYDNAGLMSEEIAKRSVDLLKKIPSSDQITISFFGGEPLLNLDTMRNLVDYSIRTLKDKKVNFQITTNGTILNPEILELFKKYNFKILVSIDGDKEHHDKYRRYKDDRPSYDAAVENIKKMKDSGLNLCVRATLCHGNTDIATFIQNFAGNLDIGIRISPVMSTDISLILDKNDCDEIYQSYLKVFSRAEAAKRYKEVFYNSQLSAAISYCQDLSISRPRPYFCGAGIRMISVDACGNVYPCHGLVGIEEFKIGNVIDDIYLDKLEGFLAQVHLANKKSCSTCFARNFCGGGCCHYFYLTNGDLNLPHDGFCGLMKTLYKLAVIFCVYMKDQKLPEDLARDPFLVELNDILLDR
jgi:uncharacterized protein